MRVPQSWPGEQDQNNEVINSSSLSDRYNTTTLTGGMGYTYKGIYKHQTYWDHICTVMGHTTVGYKGFIT